MDEKSEDNFLPQRIVHLDLKGAPPKISFLLKIIPMFKQWGATGLLVEYEDMFPYKEKMSILSKDYCYSSDDIKLLQEVTKAEGMKYIPLLQSFGHVEFILKKKEYLHLREASMNPMSLCPTNKESLPLVVDIVDQYIQEHNDIEYLHIGGDEVFCIGVCKDCIASQQTHNQLFLSHMMPLLKIIQSKYPNLKLFIWDDMFRDFTVKELESLGHSVTPMVWAYGDDLTGKFPNGMWQRYADVFDEIWVASSYKGSSGPCCDMVPIQHHLNNHLSWLALIDNLDPEISDKIKGIALTGWSRYDHYATFCELLPVSAPCLALCLQVLKERSFTKQLHEDVSKKLGFLNLIPVSIMYISYDAVCGNFPGSELIVYISQLEIAKRNLTSAEERIGGWMDSWRIEVSKELNFGHLEYICTILNQSLQIYESIRGPLLECLSFHFYEETVREFVKVKLDSKLKKGLEMLNLVQTNKATIVS